MWSPVWAAADCSVREEVEFFGHLSYNAYNGVLMVRLSLSSGLFNIRVRVRVRLPTYSISRHSVADFTYYFGHYNTHTLSQRD